MDDARGSPIEGEAEERRWAAWMDALEAGWRSKIAAVRAEYRGDGRARDSAGGPGGARAAREP